jgi:hypothetical protein
MLSCAVASPGRGRGEHAAHEPTAHHRVERPGHQRPGSPAKSSPAAAVEAGTSTRIQLHQHRRDPCPAPDHRMALMT